MISQNMYLSLKKRKLFSKKFLVKKVIMKPSTGIWKEVDDFVKKQNIPIHMMLEVSRRCNINCIHCYNIKDRSHLSLEQLNSIMAQLREAGCLFLTLTGGEIFARPDAVDILYMARDYGFDLRMITNGTLITMDNAKVLCEVSMMEVGVSLLGATPDTHDKIAQVPGAYARSIQGIKNCIAQKVPVHIKCTLMNENVHEYKQVMALAKKLGVVYMIDPIISPRDDGDIQNLKHRLNEKLMEEFYREQFENMIPDDDEEDDSREKGLPCDAGTGFGAISADGSIYPCIQMPKKIGNIFEDDFKDVWQNAESLRALRNVRGNNCSSCEGACSPCPGLSYLETGDPFGPSSVACSIGKLYKKFDAEKKGTNDTPQSCGGQHTCH